MTAAWRRLARCASEDQTMFFPEEFTGATQRMAERAALGMCRDCRVRVDCLAAALREEPAADLVHGIRGGLTVSQRRTLTAMIANPAPDRDADTDALGRTA